MDFMFFVPELIWKFHDVTFMLTVAAFVYAFYKCVLGRILEFPGVTHAIEWQIFVIDRKL
ncbi:hypothetical protein MKW92_037329 [Papaver armeniacum]|nr:hypothetical protein MKW92_037329 [Papaver armeniacum]